MKFTLNVILVHLNSSPSFWWHEMTQIVCSFLCDREPQCIMGICCRSTTVWGHQSLHAQRAGWAGAAAGRARHRSTARGRWGRVSSNLDETFHLHHSWHRYALAKIIPFSPQRGVTARGCEMERGAGFPPAVPQRSPIPQPWRTTCRGWNVCAKKPTFEWCGLIFYRPWSPDNTTALR